MTHYRTVEIDGLKIFYREAGDPKNPMLLLLHGFPASSFMFRELIDRLSDQFHLVAPAYPVTAMRHCAKRSPTPLITWPQ